VKVVKLLLLSYGSSFGIRASSYLCMVFTRSDYKATDESFKELKVHRRPRKITSPSVTMSEETTLADLAKTVVTLSEQMKTVLDWIAQQDEEEDDDADSTGTIKSHEMGASKLHPFHIVMRQPPIQKAFANLVKLKLVLCISSPLEGRMYYHVVVSTRTVDLPSLSHAKEQQ
jgi:hypothetical protein